MTTGETPPSDPEEMRNELLVQALGLLTDIVARLRRHVGAVIVYLAVILTITLVGLLLSIRYSVGLSLLAMLISAVGGGAALIHRRRSDEDDPPEDDQDHSTRHR